MIKQIDKTRLEITENISAETIKKTFIKIKSKEGQKLIKEHNLVTDPDMLEL